jgi:hypothetical protein
MDPNARRGMNFVKEDPSRRDQYSVGLHPVQVCNHQLSGYWYTLCIAGEHPGGVDGRTAGAMPGVRNGKRKACANVSVVSR